MRSSRQVEVKPASPAGVRASEVLSLSLLLLGLLTGPA